MALYLKRPPGGPAEPEDWARRNLPRPTAQAAYAAVADCEAFAARWAPRAEALGIDPAGPLTVLGDGAEWIWNAAAARFPAATQILDVFHAGEHLAAAAKALFGDGVGEAADWTERGRRALLADGWPGLLDHVGATSAERRTAAGQAGLDDLIRYFAKHTDRLGYYGRLRTGRSIGSGGVESLARRMGRRLKVPGRGWCVDRLEGMSALIATADTTEWDGLWTPRRLISRIESYTRLGLLLRTRGFLFAAFPVMLEEVAPFAGRIRVKGEDHDHGVSGRIFFLLACPCSRSRDLRHPSRGLSYSRVPLRYPADSARAWRTHHSGI